MRAWLLTPILLGLLAGGAPAGDEPPSPAAPAVEEEIVEVLTLREAASRGLVSAEGFQPSSYRRVFLRMKNRTQEPLDVDLCGSHLKPKRGGSCQRLGIGPPVTPRPRPKKKVGGGTVVIHLAPEEEIELELNTCCLDAGRPAPSKHEFVVARKSLPPVREKVLRWWADNPTAPQHAVNSAIWQFRDTVHVTPGVVPGYQTPQGRFAAVHGGTYYRIDDGELMSLDADGIERFLGTEIFQVIPVEGAVYAVALGEDRLPDLWRLTLTGLEPWGFVMDLSITDRVRDVIPATGGNLVLVTDAGLRYWNKEGRTLSTSLSTQQILHLSTRLAGRGRMSVTVQRPPREPTYKGGERVGEAAPVYELWSVDLATGTSERVKEYWNVQGMRAGPAGVYGLSHKGRLRRLVGTSFRDHGTADTFSRILAVGRKALWLVGEDGRLCVAKASTGRVRHVVDVPVADLGVVDVDATADDLAFVKDDRWTRVRADTGAVEEIAGEEEVPVAAPPAEGEAPTR
jgi:hypothetical protein